MDRIDINDGLVKGLIAEISPLVSEITGWDLQIRTLRFRVLPQDQAYEEILLGRIKHAGVNLENDSARGIVERLLEYVFENSVLAAYEPATQEILVVRENVDESSLDGLRLVIAHELVHRGQHIHHGSLFERMDECLRRVFTVMSTPGRISLKSALAEIRNIQPVMTLIESHAYYVQNLLKCSRFREAVIESHFNLPFLLMRVLGARKLAQYKDGIPAITAAAAGGRVESLYASA